MLYDNKEILSAIKKEFEDIEVGTPTFKRMPHESKNWTAIDHMKTAWDHNTIAYMRSIDSFIAANFYHKVKELVAAQGGI